MARLLASAQDRLSTDFAMLDLWQRDLEDGGGSGTYATSVPGRLALHCGTKYTELDVRLERWDERPPEADPRWEDCDELPWEAVEGAGPLMMSGFDGHSETAVLEVSDLGRARVQVLARGRHRYNYGNSPDEGVETAEEWLIRIWPDPLERDLLEAPPRRLAGPHPMHHPQTAYQAALATWDTTGWDSRLHSLEGGHRLQLALYPEPATREALLTRMGQPNWGAPVAGNFGPQIDASNARSPESFRRAQVEKQSVADYIAEIAGIPVATFGDLLEALLRIGVLFRQPSKSGELIVPSPCPPPVWTLAHDVDEATAERMSTAALSLPGRELEDDLECAMRWAPQQQLRSTTRQLAARWAITTADIVLGLQYLDSRQYTITPSAETLDDTQELTIISRLGS